MTASLRNKFGLIIGIILVCVFYLFAFGKDQEGEFHFHFPTSLEQARANLADHINLGLDLRGGMHLILQVQVEEAIESESGQLTERLRTLFADEGIGAGVPYQRDTTHVIVAGIPPDQLGLAGDILNDTYAGYNIRRLSDAESGYVLEMTPAYQAQIRVDALRNSIGTIRQRIDFLGVSETWLIFWTSGAEK